MDDYHKRTYGSVGEFVDDFRFMLRNRRQVHRAMQTITPAFRERLMLAVTQVNGCRYCAYYHARMALREGMDHAEVQAMLQGTVGTCPPEEETAILYAQHWAETAAEPDPDARAKVLEVYGEEKTQAIELFLQMIRMGNYMGNTFAYFLYRISGGHWGNH